MRSARVGCARGFTLTELAVVFAIVSLLLATAMYTLSAQQDQRGFEETRRRLDAARELLLSFAVANGRLPCPGTTSGNEAFTGANCTSPWGGFLPGRAIGFQIMDANGFALDAWNNRIRYAVSSHAVALVNCAGSSTQPHFTNATNLRTNGITCQPGDLSICASATGITATSCNSATPLVSQNTVVALVFSTGKNGATGGTGTDEAANLNSDRVFVWHTPTPASAANGEFDDQMTWIPVGELYARLIAAGVLP
ncbi:MAG: pilus assembly FimT family protein [Burkholderiales bacterium]